MSHPSAPRSFLLRRAGATACALLLTVVACEKEESGDDAAEPGTSTGMIPEPPDESSSSSSSDGADSSSGEPGSESTGAPACGAPELCFRTINECEIDLTQEQCELWYADPVQNMCDDIDGYTACNCSCVEEPTCDEYFSCGMLCFEDYC